MDDRAPYLGLDPFEEADERYFFGRAADVRLIVANLFAARLTVLFGPSGVGKSSVLHAGVMPALRGREHVLAATVAPTDRPPDSAVREAVAASAAAAGLELPASTGSLADDLQAIAASSRRRVMLIFDQFEDQVAGPRGEALMDELAALLSRPSLPVFVLIAVREEALAVLDRFEGRVAGVYDNLLRLRYPDAAAGAQAIREPVRVWNDVAGASVDVEATLVDAVLAGVTTTTHTADAVRAVEPAHLQLVMKRVWEAERAAGSRVLRLSTLESLGGPATIVRDHVRVALALLSEPDQALAAVVLDRLVTPSGARVAHLGADLARYAGVSETRLRPVLTRLSRERVLRSVEPLPGGDARYEVFHELLADAALAWLNERTASEAKRSLRRRVRLLTAVAVTSLLALAIVIVLALEAERQRDAAVRQRENASARAYTANAAQLMDVDPEKALALGHEALRLRTFDETVATVRSALARSWERRVLDARPGALSGAAIDRQGIVLTAGLGGTATLWDGSSKRALPGRSEAAAFCPDAGRVAVAGPDGARLLLNGREVILTRRAPVAPSIACNADGSRIVVADERGAALYTRDGSRRATLPPRHGPSSDVDLDAAGAVAVVVAVPGTVTVWDVAGRRAPRTLAAEDVFSAAISADGRRVLTGGSDGTVTMWDARSGRRLAVLRGHRAVVRDVDLDPRGELGASAATDRTVRVWDLAGGVTIDVLRGHDAPVNSVAFSPDGRRLATGGDTGVARIWETPAVPFAGGQRGAVVAALDRDGGRLAVGDARGVVRVWDTRRRTVISRERASGPALAVALAGSSLLAVEERRATVWRLGASGAPRTFGDDLDPVLAAALSPDGERVATGHEDGTVRVRAANGGPVGESLLDRDGPVVRVAFGAGGRRLAAVSFPGALWIGASDGRGMRRVARLEAITAVAVAPDGDRIAAAGDDNIVRILAARDGRVLARLRGHLGTVRTLSFSDGGRVLASAGADERVLLWDVVTGTQLAAFPATGAALAERGTTLLTAGPERSARLLRCDACLATDQLLRLARARITRPLSAADKRRYGG